MSVTRHGTSRNRITTEHRRILNAAAAVGMLASPACSEASTDSVAQWTLSEELRIGSESSPEYALTDVRGIEVSEEGDIFVLQPADGSVRVFDENGRFLTYIGRAGEGPGELMDIASFGLHGDTIWISDRRGIHRFESNGTYLDSEMLRYEPSGAMLSSGSASQIFIDGTLAIMPSFIPTLDRSTWPTHLPLHRVAGDEFRGELAAFDLNVIQLYTPADGRTRPAFRPFHPLAVHGYAPDRRSLAVVHQAAAEGSADATFRLSRIGYEGDTIVSRNVPYTPVPVPSAIRDSIEASVPAALSAARFAAAPIPEYYPPVRSLTIADDGSLWLDLQGHQPSRWMVLDSAGNHTANVTGEGAMRIVAIRERTVWGVVTDSLDIPYVVRSRILQR